MVQDEFEQDEVIKHKKGMGKGKIIAIVLALILLAGAGAGGGFYLYNSGQKAKAAVEPGCVCLDLDTGDECGLSDPSKRLRRCFLLSGTYDRAAAGAAGIDLHREVQCEGFFGSCQCCVRA